MVRTGTLLLLALLPWCVASRTVWSCGQPGDHLHDEKFSVSPDPIERHQPFTFELTGNLDEDLTEIFADVDLDIKFLKVFNHQLNFTLKISGKPGLSKGPTKIVVGPFVLNDGWLPAQIYASGTVKLRDGKGRPIGCGKLDGVNFGSSWGSERQARSPEVGRNEGGIPIPKDWNCGEPADHMKNVTFVSTDDSLAIMGTVDEPLNDVTLTSSNEIKLWFLHKTITISTPLKYSPGFPAGPFELKLELVGKAPVVPTIGKVLGYIKLDDAKGEEMLCFDYGVNPNKENGHTLV